MNLGNVAALALKVLSLFLVVDYNQDGGPFLMAATCRTSAFHIALASECTFLKDTDRGIEIEIGKVALTKVKEALDSELRENCFMSISGGDCCRRHRRPGRRI